METKDDVNGEKTAEADRKLNDIDAVVARLKISKAQHEQKAQLEAENAGSVWAQTVAEYSELVAIDEAEDEREIYIAIAGGEKALEDTNFVREAEMKVQEAVGFWIGCNDDLDEHSAFLWAFRDGAVEVFEKVRDKL